MLLFCFYRKLTFYRKSQIAINYVYWVRKHYPEISIFWIHAATIDRFHQGYRKIAQDCCIPGIENPNADVLQLVKHWLQDETNGKWLMVIDNADRIEDFFQSGKERKPVDGSREQKLGSYIPKTTQGSILVTSRDKQCAIKFANRDLIEVPRMIEAESECLVSSVLTDKDYDPNELKKLVSTLDHLPLALVQAAAYIEENSSTIERYLEIYHESEDSAVELLDITFESGGRDPYIPNAVATSWMVSFDQIRAATPRAADILSLMAFFDRQAIPESLLKDSTEGILSFDMAIGKLLAYSLITKNLGNKHFDVHHLAHLISRAWLRQHGEAEKWSTVAQHRLLERFPQEAYDEWDRCGLYLPHARAAVEEELKNPSGTYSQPIDNIVGLVDRYLSLQGSYSSSNEISHQRLNYCIDHLGPEHPATLKSVLNMAKASGNHLFGPKDATMLTIMDNLRFMLGITTNYDQHEPMLRLILKLQERVLGTEDPATLMSMNNLASSLDRQGKYSAAEQMHRQALESRQKVLGLTHPDTLTSMDNLASVLDSQCKYKEVEQILQQTLELRREFLGPQHPDTLRNMFNLMHLLDVLNAEEASRTLHSPEKPARLIKLSDLMPELSSEDQNEKPSSALSSSENFARLEKLFRSRLRDFNSLKREEKSNQTLLATELLSPILFSSEDPDRATSLDNTVPLLDIKAKTKNKDTEPPFLYLENTDTQLVEGIAFSEMEQALRKILVLQEKDFGLKHHDTPAILGSLALVLRAQGNFLEAEQILQRSLQIQQELLGEKHPESLITMNNLAMLLHTQGRQDEAEQILQKALRLQQEHPGFEHSDALVMLKNLATVLESQQNYQESEQIHRQALRIMEETLGKEDSSVLETLGDLGFALYSQGKYNEAEQAYRQELRLRQKVMGDKHPSTLKSMNNLAEVLRGQRKFKEAEEALLKTLELCEEVLGEEHADTLKTMSNLALLLYAQAMHKEGEEMMRRTVKLQQKVLGPDHSDTLESKEYLDLISQTGGVTRSQLDGEKGDMIKGYGSPQVLVIQH
jgi:tetratricopeptide (TPR) repeat protein